MKKLTLCPADAALWQRVEKEAFRLAALFKLPLNEAEPKARPICGNAMGLCYVAQGKISIALRWKEPVSDGGKWWPRPLPLHEVIETLAHELAHLRIVPHGKEHDELTALIRAQVILS